MKKQKRISQQVQIGHKMKNNESKRVLNFITMMYDKIDELGWNPDDELDVEIIENCTDTGEYDSLVVINKTIEGND